MSAAAPSGDETEADALRRAQRAHEPSMEEILASIRAIIADDRDAEPTMKVGPQIVYSSDAPARPSLAEPPPAATVVWARPSAQAPVSVEPEPPAPVVMQPRLVGVVSAVAQPRAPAEAEPEADFVADSDPLLSDEADGAVAASFRLLSESMASHGKAVAERLAREMLKPMLKSWLDENLPPMVERLVRAEIARVARGGR